jgi:hypothetical protein
MLGPMSWAVYAMTAPGGLRTLDALPEGYRPPSLGTAAELVERIREAAPETDTGDPRWLTVRGEEYDIEVTVGKGVDVRDVTFYINSGAKSPTKVLDICRQLGITAYDTESGDALTPDSAPPVPPPLDEDELPKRRWWRRRT